MIEGCWWARLKTWMVMINCCSKMALGGPAWVHKIRKVMNNNPNFCGAFCRFPHKPLCTYD